MSTILTSLDLWLWLIMLKLTSIDPGYVVGFYMREVCRYGITFWNCFVGMVHTDANMIALALYCFCLKATYTHGMIDRGLFSVWGTEWRDRNWILVKGEFWVALGGVWGSLVGDSSYKARSYLHTQCKVDVKALQKEILWSCLIGLPRDDVCFILLNLSVVMSGYSECSWDVVVTSLAK